jgi:SNF2 family DNA or RNA helicase
MRRHAESGSIPLLDPRWYALSLRGRAFLPSASFASLLAPQVLYDRIQPHAYQLRVVERVLRDLSPAAILADEVGLGKTIEAGLVYKELALRGVVQSALVLAPKALLSQWQEELRERFDDDFVLTDERRFQGFDVEQRIVCSLPQFVRSFGRIAHRRWDLLIVDEAHLLSNPQSKRRQCVAQLRARWRLLLTATPIANRLTDLYSLLDLVAPGMFGTQREFENAYVADLGTARVVRPQRAEHLRKVVGEVMCRTRRSETDIAFSGRTVHTRSIEPAPDEDALITDVTNYLRALYRRIPLRRSEATREAGAQQPPHDAARTQRINRGAVIREIMALQQSLSSSPGAIERSLRKRTASHQDEAGELLALAGRAHGVVSAKETLLRELLNEAGNEPLLIFTLRLETASHLCELIRASGRRADSYVGALSRQEREDLVGRFNSGQLDVLVATDAGAEGLNLQRRCHTVVNYDLHWNPMRIEQRIGRVHRLGQPRDVAVYNFVLKDTIDDYVVHLLYQKVELFTMTIGAMETVLAEAQEGELDMEERLLDALLGADSNTEVRASVDSLGNEIALARERQRAAESLTSGVLG